MRSRMFALAGALTAPLVMVGALLSAGTAVAQDTVACGQARDALIEARKAQTALPVDATETQKAAAAQVVANAQARVNAECTAPTTPPTTPPTTTTSAPAPVLSCVDYARQDIFDIRVGDPRYSLSLDRDRDGVACERVGEGRRDVRLPDKVETDTTITRDGDCTTVTTTTREFERSLRRWNDLAVRYRDARELNDDVRRELDGAYRDRVLWEGRYGQVRRLVDTDTRSNTVCKTVAPARVIRVEAPPITYTTPRQVSRVPSGSIETGDGSIG